MVSRSRAATFSIFFGNESTHEHERIIPGVPLSLAPGVTSRSFRRHCNAAMTFGVANVAELVDEGQGGFMAAFVVAPTGMTVVNGEFHCISNDAPLRVPYRFVGQWPVGTDLDGLDRRVLPRGRWPLL